MGPSARGAASSESGTADRRLIPPVLGQIAHFLGALVAGLLLSLGAAPASAQVYANDPPHPMATDQNGVDMLTATPTVRGGTVSIGPAKGGLSFSSTWRGYGPSWTDLTQTGINVAYSQMGLPQNNSPATVSVGTSTDMFPTPLQSWDVSPCNPLSYLSMLGTGGVLAYNCPSQLWTYTARDGTIYTFNPGIYSYSDFQNPYRTMTVPIRGNNFGTLTSIQRPDGEVVTYHYNSNGRVQSITNNRGYQIKFLYYTNTFINSNTNAYDPNYRAITQVIGINNAADYCDPNADSCAGFNGAVGPSGTTWPNITYGYIVTSAGYLWRSSETDAAGNVTTYANNPIFTITTPAGLVMTVGDGHQYVPDGNETINVSNAQAQVTINGQTWNYQYTCTQTSTLTVEDNYGGKLGQKQGFFCSGATVARTDPAGNMRTLVLVLSNCWSACSLNPPSGSAVATSIVSSPYLVITDTDELSRVTNYEYDEFDRVGYIKHPEGNYSDFTYDGDNSTSRGNLINITNYPKPSSSLGNILYSAIYPSTCTNTFTCNKPTSTTDALNNTTSYTYDPATGFVLTKTSPADSAGVQPQIRYSYTGVPTYALNSAGAAVQVGTITELTATSECSSGTAPACIGTAAEQRTTYAYANDNGLMSSQTVSAGTGSWALNLTTSYVYTPQGDAAIITDPRGNQHDIGFDALRRKTGEGYLAGASLPWLWYASHAYDGDSDLTGEWRATGFDANNHATGWQYWQTTYTPTHKVKTKVDPANDVTSYSYDSLDRLSTVTDPTGYVTQYQYDAASQKLQEQRAVGTPLQQNYATFTYSQNGKVLSEADARGNAITYTYDGFDRLAVTTYADGTTEKNQYDPMSQITIWTNRAALDQIRCYDALGRKTTEQSVTGATNQGACVSGGTPNRNADWWDFYNRSFTYDLEGRMLTASSASGWNHTYTYDNAGRVLTHSDNLGTFNYGHDAGGNLVSISHPNGSVVGYAYDALDRMTSATLNGATLASLYWDALSRRTSMTYGDGSSVGYGYDAADRLTSLSQTFPNTSSANVTFGFGYDAASRLTSRSVSNSAYEFSSPVASVAYATANTLNEYPSVGGVARTYWPTGALSNDTVLNRYYDQTGTAVYAYTVASGGAESLSMPSDALGRPFQRNHNNPNASPGFPSGVNSVIYFSNGPERPEVMYDRTYTGAYNVAPSTFQGDRLYVLGPNADERLAFQDVNGTVYYPHQDRQGSTIALSTSGQSLLTFAYDAYGKPSQSITELPSGASAYPWLYTGQRYDPTLIAYDYKARIYSAQDGRFWQTDPIGPKDDLNLYGYTHNSPLNGTDPSGNEEVIVTGVRAVDNWIIRQSIKFLNAGRSLGTGHGSLDDAQTVTSTLLIPFAPAEDGAVVVTADYNQALNEALAWLEERGFAAEQPTIGKFGPNAGKPIGMRTADGQTGFRVEFDARNGAHINVFAKGEKGPHFTFKATEETVNRIVKQFSK